MMLALLFAVIVLAFLTLAGLINPSLVFMRTRITVLLLLVPLNIICGLAFAVFFYQKEEIMIPKGSEQSYASRAERRLYCLYVEKREALREDQYEQATEKMLRALEINDEIIVVKRIEIRVSGETEIEQARDYDLKVRRASGNIILVTIPAATTLEVLGKPTVGGKRGVTVYASDFGIEGDVSLADLAKRVKQSTKKDDSEIAEKLEEIRTDIYPDYSKADLERIANASGWERYCANK